MAEGQLAPRTEEHFDAIRRIAEEASRGGSIESPGTVKRAAELVGNGAEVKEAIEEAKRETVRAKAAARKVKPGEPPEVIAERLRKRGIPREVLEEANRELSNLSVRSMIENGSLVCPHCGGTDLVRACNGGSLLGRKKDEACSSVAGRRLTEQTYLKRPNPRFVLFLDDGQLSIVDQLVREEIRVCRACLAQTVEKERRRILRSRIKACREIQRRIGTLKGEAG